MHELAVKASQCTSSQCRTKVGAVDAAALGPFKKCAHGHLYFGCDFIKIVATRCHILKLKCTKFDFGRI